MFWAQRLRPASSSSRHGQQLDPLDWRGLQPGIDGISFLLIMLTTLLGWISILSSWTAIEIRVKEYYVWFLLLQTGMLGVFMALDFFLFFVFWEAMLVPMYLLIGIWADAQTLCGHQVLLVHAARLGLMLLAFCPVFPSHTLTGVFTFSIPNFIRPRRSFRFRLRSGSSSLSLSDSPSKFRCFRFTPGYRMRTWRLHRRSVILAGVLLKMGRMDSYVSRCRSSRSAHEFRSIHGVYARGWVVGLSVIGIVYGALVSLMQKDMKKLVAYSSVSHLGFCTLGIFALNSAGLTGSVLQQVNHGISTGALFLIVGILYERSTRAKSPSMAASRT